MSEQMSATEIVDALVAKGVPRERAEVVARSNMGATLPNVLAASPSVAVDFPIRITLPWSALCSDNEREAASMVSNGAKVYPRKVMTARYKAAREKVVSAGRRAMLDASPLDVPLALVARVYAPTQRRVDVANFAKGVHDALNKIVYTDDQWLWDVRWVRAGTDMDAPRVEIEVTPL